MTRMLGGLCENFCQFCSSISSSHGHVCTMSHKWSDFLDSSALSLLKSCTKRVSKKQNDTSLTYEREFHVQIHYCEDNRRVNLVHDGNVSEYTCGLVNVDEPSQRCPYDIDIAYQFYRPDCKSLERTSICQKRQGSASSSDSAFSVQLCIETTSLPFHYFSPLLTSFFHHPQPHIWFSVPFTCRGNNYRWPVAQLLCETGQYRTLNIRYLVISFDSPMLHINNQSNHISCLDIRTAYHSYPRGLLGPHGGRLLWRIEKPNESAWHETTASRMLCRCKGQVYATQLLKWKLQSL